MFTNIISAVGNFLWSAPMPILLAATHFLMTAKTGVIQKKLPKAIKLSVSRDDSSGGSISQFQALTTALASTIGTGNIIGLGTAIALGGAGAVFWCWFAGVIGMATKYAESLLAVKYRVTTADGRTVGGAMYILENRLHMKFLAKMFALCTALTALGVGCGVQINAISEVITGTAEGGDSYVVNIFGLSLPLVPLLVGVTAAVIVCVVIFGGVRSISRVCEKLVPTMAGLYVAGCVVILVANCDVLWESVVLIVRSAFSSTAAVGGLAGYSVGAAMRYGISRGLFSNEAGMGSAPIVASAAKTKNPARQALVSATGTFWDTVVLCLITGLVLVSSILKNGDITVTPYSGGVLTLKAFSQIPYLGKPLLMFGIITFAFSTILGWSYYGESCSEYLFGKRGVTVFRAVYAAVLVVAPLVSLNIIWSIADILNALMAMPNLTALIILRNEVRDDTKYYMAHLDDKSG